MSGRVRLPVRLSNDNTRRMEDGGWDGRWDDRQDWTCSGLAAPSGESDGSVSEKDFHN